MPLPSRHQDGKRSQPILPADACLAKTTVAGEPGTRVPEHLRSVGAVAERLTANLPQTVLAKAPFSPVIPALLHDVGKVSPGFQLHISRDYVRSVLPELAALSPGCTDHACTGATSLRVS